MGEELDARGALVEVLFEGLVHEVDEEWGEAFVLGEGGGGVLFEEVKHLELGQFPCFGLEGENTGC